MSMMVLASTVLYGVAFEDVGEGFVTRGSGMTTNVKSWPAASLEETTDTEGIHCHRRPFQTCCPFLLADSLHETAAS